MENSLVNVSLRWCQTEWYIVISTTKEAYVPFVFEFCGGKSYVGSEKVLCS